MAQDVNIIYLRIHGWGVVASEDSILNTLIGVDNVAGTAAFSIVGTANLWDLSQVGSEVWVEGVPGLEDSFYTLYTIFKIPGFTYIYIKGDPDKFNATVGALPTGAVARIEDHYKICSDIPDWVQGSAARSRWIPKMTDITPTLSAEVDLDGGIGKVDGISIAHNYIFEGFDKSRFKILNEDDNIQTSGELYRNTNRVINIEVRNGIPYMGSYDNPDTPPTLGLYEPTWWGSECIRVDSASGSGPYLIDITRSLLRTERTTHTYGGLFYDGFTSPLGKNSDVIKLPIDADNYDDGELLLTGPILSGDYGSGVVSQTLLVSADILRALRQSAWDILPMKWRPSVDEIEYFDKYGSTWQWVLIGHAAFRIMGFHNSSLTNEDYPGSKRFDVILSEDDARRNYFGYARVISAVIKDRYLTIDGQTVGNGIMVKTVKDPNKFAKYNYAVDLPAVAANQRYPDVNDPDREQFIENFSKNYLYWQNAGRLGSPSYNFDVIREDESDLDLCHVFEPQYFGPDNSFEYNSTTVPVIGVNPIDVLLQILLTKYGLSSNDFTYEGTTYNYDILPAAMGLRFSPDSLEMDTFMKAAAQFDETGISFYNMTVIQDDADDMSKWINDNILKPLFMSLVTNSKGRLELTQLADSARKPNMVSLQNSDLFVPKRGDSVKLQRDISKISSRITYEIVRPYVTPDNPSHKDVVNYQYAYDGLSDHYLPLGASDVKFKLDYAPFRTTADSEAFASYLGRYLANRRVPISMITCYVDTDFEPVNFMVGKYQIIDLQYLPDAFDTDENNLFGVGLVVSRKKDILEGADELKIALVETLNTNTQVTFASSAEVDTGSTGTVIQLVDSKYIPSFVSSYDSDAESFTVGDAVLLYDENFVLRSTANIPVVDAINSTTEIEIDTDFEDGGGPITPNAGDIIVLADKASQTIANTENNFAYVFTSRSDASFWEIN